MKLHLIENAIRNFLTGQATDRSTDWYFPHSIVGHFHAAWQSLSEQGLKVTYNLALQSDISNRWWKQDGYRPKEIMLQLIDADPELAAIAWKDLAQVNASLDGRLSRFSYYCDQLLDIHRQQHINSIETYHHQDARILSLYLAGLFPDAYTLYPGLDTFQRFCKNIGSPDIPKVDDQVRYMKVANIVFTYLKKNEKFEALLEMREGPQHKIECIPFQVSYEVIHDFANSGRT